jgi:predicted nucleic acid-binding protein
MPRRKPTVLIDTNILISGLVFLKGNEHKILKLAEDKEIAANALAKYKKLSLMNHIKNPRKALKTMFDQPQLIVKYIKNLF